MAQLMCTQHGDEPAAVIIGMVQTGDQLILCAGCLAGWVTTVHAAYEASVEGDDEPTPEASLEPADEPPAPTARPKRSRGATEPTEAAPKPSAE